MGGVNVRKIKWFLKQLFPLTYKSKYEIGGKPVISVWKMHFGKVYQHERYLIAGEV